MHSFWIVNVCVCRGGLHICEYKKKNKRWNACARASITTTWAHTRAFVFQTSSLQSKGNKHFFNECLGLSFVVFGQNSLNVVDCTDRSNNVHGCGRNSQKKGTNQCICARVKRCVCAKWMRKWSSRHNHFPFQFKSEQSIGRSKHLPLQKYYKYAFFFLSFVFRLYSCTDDVVDVRSIVVFRPITKSWTHDSSSCCFLFRFSLLCFSLPLCFIVRRQWFTGDRLKLWIIMVEKSDRRRNNNSNNIDWISFFFFIFFVLLSCVNSAIGKYIRHLCLVNTHINFYVRATALGIMQFQLNDDDEDDEHSFYCVDIPSPYLWLMKREVWKRKYVSLSLFAWINFNACHCNSVLPHGDRWLFCTFCLFLSVRNCNSTEQMD